MYLVPAMLVVFSSTKLFLPSQLTLKVIEGTRVVETFTVLLRKFLTVTIMTASIMIAS